MKKTIVRRPQALDNHLPAVLHPIIKQLYACRGVASEQALDLVVNNLAGVKDLNAAFKGIEQACELLYSALKNKTNIIIIGDFDADGATSTALMMIALSLLGSQNHDFIVPNRFEYGYGLTPEIVDIAAQQGAQMLVTVDNGISCIAGV
jgi:single-stranded-DNA-specific exonuclease